MDHSEGGSSRCRIWCVRPREDPKFRAMCEAWYDARGKGAIKSANFQLHPPRGLDANAIRNTFGNLHYPLLFCAVRDGAAYELKEYDPGVLISGLCSKGDDGNAAEVLVDEGIMDLFIAKQ